MLRGEKEIYNTLQHAVSRCNTLQHTVTHCNTLQHTATYKIVPMMKMFPVAGEAVF